MKFAQFTDEYRTGDRRVDAQHEGLFEMVQSLHDAIVAQQGKEAISPTLQKLAKYTVEHFRTEERLMMRVGYPEYAAHKRMHDGLTKRAMEIIEGYESGKIALPLTLSRFLAEWLKTHIKGEDKRMIEWMKARGHKAA